MDEDRVRDELNAVKEAVEQLTGLRSRWSSNVILLDTAQMVALKGMEVLAEKRWACDIVVNSGLILLPLRWRTFIHEMIHSVSVGSNETDYKRLRGWEEGVVEQMQRQLRPQILGLLQAQAAEAACDGADRRWIFNPYVEALEALRVPLETAPGSFYLNLLKTPLGDRLAYVRALSDTAEHWRRFAYTVGRLR